MIHRRRPSSSLWLALSLWLAVLPGTGSAASPTSAEEIFARAEQARSVENSIQTLRMVLVGRNGAERVRVMEMRIRRDGEVLKSYTRFSEPSDVAGTQLVMVDHPDQLDEQLLYLPALRRVQRIAGKARSGSFMGSDFSYEDLEISSAKDAAHRILSEDAESWLIETVPAAGTSSYGRLVSRVTKADYLPRKVEFFDLQGRPLKVLTVEETARDGATVIPKVSVMADLQKGTRTRLEVVSHRLNVPATEIPDEVFTAAYMERSG